MYAIKFQSGHIDQEYVGKTKADVWDGRGFWWCCDNYGEDWKNKYWKRREASVANFKKNGHSIVKVKIVEVA